MAIIIQNLQPTNPAAVVGATITFNVNAYDDGGLTLNYQWQYSVDGISYTPAGLTNNTTATYQTGTLSSSSDGLYYRVVISTTQETVNSNDYAGIGDRQITVTAQPSIITMVNALVDDYPNFDSSKTALVGDIVSWTVSATLANEDISVTTNVGNIDIEWQSSIDGGSTFLPVNLSTYSPASIVSQVSVLTSSPLAYYKLSTFELAAQFAFNQHIFRAVITYPGATNSPVIMTEQTLFINPEISIFQQPGTGANDTQEAFCYKTGTPNSGEIFVEVGAITSSAQSLSYQWEVSIDNGINWREIQEVTVNDTVFFNMNLRQGTSFNSSTLELVNVVYYDTIGLRCIIGGTAGEVQVTSNEHYVYMRDSVVSPTLPSSIDIAEDRYGPITGRENFSSAIISTQIIGEQAIDRDTGLNGNLVLTMEESVDGGNTWYDTTSVDTLDIEDDYFQYTSTPPIGTDALTFVHPTDILRRSTDNGKRYRIRTESSAIFTLSGNTKTLTPIYSTELLLNVYRAVYIDTQPANLTSFPNVSAAFSVFASVSSGASTDITYQWQYNTQDSESGWVNVPNSGIYNGANTNTLIISAVPTTVTYGYFRCVVDCPDSLSSVTSTRAYLNTKTDLFVTFSTLNDVFTEEYQNVSWDATATSESAFAPTYQWQKSVNYNPTTDSGTWTNIAGKTSATYEILGVTQADIAYYRCVVTSYGGFSRATNASNLTVSEVAIKVIVNTPNSINALESLENSIILECEGFATNSSVVNYQWEKQLAGTTAWLPLGTGFNGSDDNSRIYIPNAFSKDADHNAKIRCKMTASGVPGEVYTNEIALTVTRRFTYFADTATKTVTIGETVILDLVPTFTGGTPSYQWRLNGSPISGQTNSSLNLLTIDSSYNGNSYTCEVTLPNCDEFVYSRNNTVFTTTSNITQSITFNVVASAQKPKYYSKEIEKTGAAIGTVICVPKPPGYNVPLTQQTDDISSWKVAVSGGMTSGGASSSTAKVGGGQDRFFGYLEMRGQYLKALDFPELARVFGTKYGGSIVGSYPNYNSNDTFRMPTTYGKRLMGTGNVNNNSGSVSLIPLYDANGNTGGDKNIPGSYGGEYNYTKSMQLPPGSPGLSGVSDGTADGSINQETLTVGQYNTEGFDEITAFAQPTFSGTATYKFGEPEDQFTTTPVHGHSGIAIAYYQLLAKKVGCYGNDNVLNSPGPFFNIEGGGGTLNPGPHGVGANNTHTHTLIKSGGTFDVVKDGGMFISDTNLTFTGQSKSVFDNHLSFYFRNNEEIPINSPYFRLKYMIKAY